MTFSKQHTGALRIVRSNTQRLSTLWTKMIAGLEGPLHLMFAEALLWPAGTTETPEPPVPNPVNGNEVNPPVFRCKRESWCGLAFSVHFKCKQVYM